MDDTVDDKAIADPPAYEHQLAQSSGIKPQTRLLHDPAVTFEEYRYYARRTREQEKHYESPKLRWREIISHSTNKDAPQIDTGADRKVSEVNFAIEQNRLQITDEEWTNASRAMRTASWGAAFYLITTDILGPYGVGFAMGTLGWGPGIALYTVFGFMAGYSGYLIWHVFLGLDSYEFPCRNYGDLAFRTWGTPARYVTNVMQALGLLLILGQVTIQYGQNISQVSQFRLCYIVCPLLFIIAGFFMTQIRTLKNYGLVANFSVWLTVLTIFITMGVMAHSPPNYAISVLGSAGGVVDPTTITPDAQGNYPPIVHYGGLPAANLVGSINGLLSGVLAYAGAQLFVEFLAEMKRPRDFLKAMWGAQFFIYSIYLIYGCYVYHFQGQYSYQLPHNLATILFFSVKADLYPNIALSLRISYQGVSIYGWQTAGNMISLIAALIAAGLYGNIGIKVFYNNILMDIFDAPPLITRRGKIFYAAIVPVWWIIAFIIAAAIPDYFGFVSVISASMLLNLTYTLPPLFAFGYDLKENAQRESEGDGFDPVTGQVTRTGTTAQRLMRGFLSGGPLQVAKNVWHVIYFLASLSMCGLGMYAAIEGMITAFKNPQLNSFSCTSPLNLNP